MKNIFSICIIWISININAQDANCQDSLLMFSLPEINVSAFRSDIKNLETPANIQSFSNKSLKKKSFRSLPDFFDNNGNFWLQKTNHGGGSLFLRGLTGNQTLILIDGIRLNNSTFRYGPNQYLNTINPFMVSHMEVLSGGGSVQYGSDAIGGLLQVFTKTPNFEKPIDFSINTRYASYNMEKSINSSLSLTSNKFGVIMTGSLRDFGDLVGGKEIGKQTPSGYKEYAFDLKGIWKLTTKTKMTIAHQNVNQSHVPIFHKIILEDYKTNEIKYQIRNLSYLKVENEEKSRWFKKQSVSLSFQSNPEERNLQKNNSQLFRIEKDQIRTLGFSVNNISSPSSYWSINNGYEVYKDNIKSQRFDQTKGNIEVKRGLYPNLSEYINQSFFSLHQIHYQKYFLNAGLRYNTINLTIPEENIGTSSLNFNAFVYNLGLLMKLKENMAFYGNFNTSFRSPNIDDMGTLGIVDFRYEIPQKTLKPEMAKQLELGIKYSSGLHNFQLAFYRNVLSDLITRQKLAGQTIESYQVYAKMNSGKAIITGFEFNSNIKLSKILEINSGLCYTYGQDVTKNEPLRRIPPFFGNFNLRYEPSSWFLQPSIVFAGSQKRLSTGDIEDNRIGPSGTNGFFVINLMTGVNIKNINLDLSANNLANVAYKNHGSGIYQVGRSLWTSISFDI